ncbi:MAG: hypothetical protein GY940_28295 [bacterium]|nr:hypothetical protein [bacterium]
MIKKSVFSRWFVLLGLLALLLPPGCSRLSYDVEPDASAVYHSLRIKLNVKNRSTGKRQNFKALLKYNRDGDKMMFLSPLNQVYGLLFIRDENSLLINSKRKKYWRGDFRRLLEFMWGPRMDFHYSQFKQLMVRGIVPEDRVKANGIEISIKKTGDRGEPEKMQIKSPDMLVKIKISNRKTGSGRLRLSMEVDGMKQSTIRELLE